VYGLRFNPPAEEMFDMHWSFYCTRGPTWGDFYVKDGLDNICYNYNLDPGPPTVETGFLDPDGLDSMLDDVDPVGMLSDGPLDYHVLRPDSTYGSGGDPPVIPEPITLAGASMGLVALGIARLRRRERRWLHHRGPTGS